MDSGHNKATEVEGDQRVLGKEIWRKKYGQTAGYKYSWRKMEAAAQDIAGWKQVASGLWWPLFHWELLSIKSSKSS